LLTKFQKADEIPFDYARKFVSTLVQDSNGNSQLIMKGDIEHIFSRCNHVEYRGKLLPMGQDARQSVSSVVGEMLQDGMKVIAVARKNVGAQKKITPDDERGMTLVGCLSFFDAPKQTATESVTALK
ncbi:magnesium-translocating P-type ATPase, partial [Clostridioides difficile]